MWNIIHLSINFYSKELNSGVVVFRPRFPTRRPRVSTKPPTHAPVIKRRQPNPYPPEPVWTAYPPDQRIRYAYPVN